MHASENRVTGNIFVTTPLIVPLLLPPAARAATKSATGFYHPGVLVNREQLDFVKAKIAAGAEPWKSAFEAAKASEFGAREYVPKARATVECGPYSKPDLGCKDEQR